ncbi:multicopper oxidase family protein [Phaeobacter inhibens]|uniref:multicopper oxidase family protein n=1 Tax=Phaeobacter inhibens TaxID=221822 RepID=UPI000C9AA109|nr:multicopper oxidase family protein [Phaeobacter inhibens]AUQ64803.1 putative multicopper oxidase [Phaeobacter inhibens]AUQ84641.1 putative multicopper oxidase [Phaeobacter inhibens]AUQ92721.1 putative multicopper oxidase [Phaeobacter inhibens]MDO6757939.1 multicopper oxidase family protein [Phaeobacter inhibens]
MTSHTRPIRLSRRRALQLGGSAGALASFGLAGAQLTTPAKAKTSAQSSATPLPLHIQRARYAIADQPTDDLISTRPDGPPPVIRLKQGQPFAARVTNTLPDYTAMHWHGIRLDNAMDGVPYLTQFPIGEGESFDYHFTPMDAGTYWYHPHCMTMNQMAMGLTGVLVVEEAEDPGFDADIALNLRDFRLRPSGEWLKLWTARGAARSGTFGTIITANWDSDPIYEAPTGGLVRLRLAATDTARIYKPYIAGVPGQVIAADGHPLREAIDWPTDKAPALLSPGQRLDIAVQMPRIEGAYVDVMTAFPGGPRRLARIRAIGPSLGRELAELPPLPANNVPEPDLANARVEDLVFGWTPEGGAPQNGYCGSLGYTFWSINRKPWPGDAADPDTPGAGPLAVLNRGESVILRLRNESPNAHPIHLHGLVFRPLRSNKRRLPSNWTDTALLLRDEIIEVALVADNPGDWAFHCHVIEHQKTGLAGYIRVLA